MCETHIDKFLLMCDPNHIERHSDSSDFENSCDIPAIASKDGNHSLLNNKNRKTKREKDKVNRRLCDGFRLTNTKYIRDTGEMKSYHKHCLRRDKCVDCKPNEEIYNVKRSSYNNRGDQTSHYNEKYNYLSEANYAIGSCMSTILGHTNNYKPRIRENQTDIFTSNRFNKAQCTTCERRRVKKFSKQRGGYAVQPVYAVEHQTTGFPFQRSRHCMQLSQVDALTVNNNSDLSYDCSLSSGSEHEPIRHKKLMKHIMRKLEKRIRKQYVSTETNKNEQQQYPSKLQLKSPYQVFATSSCQAKCASTDSDGLSGMPSRSSAFWDLLLQKMKYQIQNAEISKDKGCLYNSDPHTPCTLDSCDFFKSIQPVTKTKTNLPNPPQTKNQKGLKHSLEKLEKKLKSYSSDQKVDISTSESDTSAKKKSKKSEVQCKCHPKSKEKPQSLSQPTSSNEQSKLPDKARPCQEKHDVITKAITDKYKGEILCIHNPPCVLINGCLNIPPPKSTTTGQGSFWPVTQSKKSSFAQICQKIKRSKRKTYEQGNQYHPPCTDVQEYLPEFRPEKIIQSVCDHNPPCEVVHGCCKTKYNPTIQNSCIHVPMCPKYPECVLEHRNVENKICGHNPKCAELPLCSRKYIILTAKENVSTQVKPKMKIGCRHQPPCLLIPKCLAQAICGNYFPGLDAIPGCVHRPSCQMIPACCRMQTKDLHSVTSQCPNSSCRIV